MEGKINAQKFAGEVFLNANKAKDGVVELPSGVQYLVLKEGKGNQPLLSDTVKAHYKGALLDGKEFDSSFKRNSLSQRPCVR